MHWETANLDSFIMDENPMARMLHMQHILAPEPLRRFLQILAPALDSSQALSAYNPKEIARKRTEILSAKSSDKRTKSNATPSGVCGSSEGSSDQRLNFYPTPSTCTGKTGRH